MRLQFLRPLFDSKGNYASVYVETSRAGETAAEAVALRWRAARQALAENGVDDATLDSVAELMTDRDYAAPGLAVFASEGWVRMSRPLPAPPRREIARYSRLPHVMPLLAQAPPRVPHLRVTANRAGGEVVEVYGEGQDRLIHVEGEGWPVHKTSVGGWSQARYQRSAEEAWAENAKELAAQVTAAVQRTGAELIVAGGDIKARSLFLDRLGQPLREIVVVVDREVPAGSDVLAVAADEAIRRRGEQACRAGLATVRNQLSRGRATEGLANTLAALSEGRVAVLFIADDPSSDATAWIGPHPEELATSPAVLRDRGVSEPIVERADAAIVRALASTGAELCFIPENEPAPKDGIGALLRYATAGT
ncbi:MAG TPA: Vms1/Ankzf1 family peptidyl-tRNA hydrolase [Streptosporangiaceae bacterium]|nr:Vms1/Ankzf1 family peptidyl-tRNA hydrolase [Streptosporangiaceae bacterium]